MIDLHTHTTASDGRLAPADLVSRAHAAGVTVLSVTDHDTIAGADAAESACAGREIAFVPGIEITAIADGTDVHVLGYFINRHSTTLRDFLDAQRTRRIDRLRQMVDKLAALGIELDADAIVAPAIDDPQKSAGRPWIARALIAAGHAVDTNDAFERYLARGRPAFVPRAGAPPPEVFARIHEAGGIASLAHPGLIGRDEWISGFVENGLDALEAYHSKHDAAATARYLGIASQLGLAVSGGSDFHGDEAHGPASPGAVALPAECFQVLKALVR